jgi:hypothetical protein
MLMRWLIPVHMLGLISMTVPVRMRAQPLCTTMVIRPKALTISGCENCRGGKHTKGI